jgi:hypothetical protein
MSTLVSASAAGEVNPDACSKRVSPTALAPRLSSRAGTEALLAPGSAGTFTGPVDGWLLATIRNRGLRGECQRQ